MLPAVVPFASPELGVRLTLEHVTGFNKGFAQPELIVAGAVREIRITGRIRGVGLDHGFCLYPRLVGTVVWVEPVVNKDQFSVSFCFVSQAILRARSRGLEGHLLPALAV